MNLCWHPDCEAAPEYRLEVVFRVQPGDTGSKCLVVPLHTRLCGEHVHGPTVEQVLNSGVWDSVCDAIRKAGGMLPIRELTTLETKPLVVGEC